jgi:hypothetical protein
VRVTTFLDPWSDAQGKGFHTIQGIFAGPRRPGREGLEPLPVACICPTLPTTYFASSAGVRCSARLIVIALFILVAYRGIRIALGAPDTFGGLMAVGITAWLAFQAINIAVVVNLMPITGITLPFVSDGGSSLIVTSPRSVSSSRYRARPTSEALERCGSHRRRQVVPALHPAGLAVVRSLRERRRALSRPGSAADAASRRASCRRRASRWSGSGCVRCAASTASVNTI